MIDCLAGWSRVPANQSTTSRAGLSTEPLATYHAYLEFPVLLALLMSPRMFSPAPSITPATPR